MGEGLLSPSPCFLDIQGMYRGLSHQKFPMALKNFREQKTLFFAKCYGGRMRRHIMIYDHPIINEGERYGDDKNNCYIRASKLFYIDLLNKYGSDIYKFGTWGASQIIDGSRGINYECKSCPHFNSCEAYTAPRPDFREKDLPRKKYKGCHYFPCCFPMYCGYNFAESATIQIQSQVEEKIGIADIHKLTHVVTDFHFFYANLIFATDEVFTFYENENGICYLYFQVRLYSMDQLRLCSKEGVIDTLLWVRCYDSCDTCRKIDPTDENNTENICFEICTELPKSFPKFEQLPELIRKKSNHYKEKGIAGVVAVPAYITEKLYDPNKWFPVVQKYFAKKKKNEEKLVQKQRKMMLEENSLGACEELKSDGKIIYENKVKVIFNDDIYECFPDVAFLLEFGCDVTEDMSKRVTEVVNDTDNSFKKEKFEFVDVRITEARVCQVGIDFGFVKPTAIKKLIKAFSEKLDGLLSIRVE